MNANLRTRLSRISTILFVLTGTAVPAVADVIHAGGVITGQETWSASGNDHIVTGAITVAIGGSLTVQDGCTVKFDQGTWLQVSGTLNVAGTAGGGVLFTRRDAGEGWYGVTFSGTDAGGTLAYCTIEHATTGGGAAAVTVNTGGMPSLQHCTLRNNAYGVSVANTASPAITVNNVIQNNTVGGIIFTNCSSPQVANQTVTGHTGVYGALVFRNCDGFRVGAGNILSGNIWAVSMDLLSSPDPSCNGNIPLAGNTTNDGIQVAGGVSDQVEVWPNLGAAAYVITGAPTVAAGGSLTIQDGITVKFDNGTWLQVGGALNVSGTAGGGVLFTRRDAGEGWYGVTFSGAGAGGILAYCTIEHATTGGGAAAVTVNSGGMPSLQHCTLRNNAYGVSVANTASPAITVNNVIQNNTVGGIIFTNCSSPQVANQTVTGHTGVYGALVFRNCDGFRVGAGNTLTGNIWAVSMDLLSSPDPSCNGNIPLAGNTANDGLQVAGGASDQAEVWPSLGAAAYVVVAAPAVAPGGSLTVQDGCTVKFDQGVWLQVSGALDVAGTAGGGVLFTRRDAGEGWYGVTFSGAGAGGTLTYCTIEHATTGGSAAAVTANSGAAPSLQHCTLRDGAIGLAANNSSPHLVNTRIVDNAQFGVYLTGSSAPTFGSSLAEWNEIHGNAPAIAGRDFTNGTADIAAHFIYWGTVVESEIEARVHHEPDNPALGRVDFGFWTNAAHDQVYGGVIGVESNDLPSSFALYGNYPNPFNPATTIRYDLPAAARVRITIIDAAGRRLATLVDEVQPAGAHSRRWDAAGMASGVYFCRLEAGSFVETRRMTLVR